MAKYLSFLNYKCTFISTTYLPTICEVFAVICYLSGEYKTMFSVMLDQVIIFLYYLQPNVYVDSLVKCVKCLQQNVKVWLSGEMCLFSAV